MRNDKIRVLHVAGVMNRAGIETWLMHVFRNIDRARYHFDFLVHSPEQGHFDEEIRQQGGRIIRSRWPKRSPLYAAGLYRAIRANGPYDVVHSHEHHLNGLILRAAALAGVPVRIAHSHNDTAPVDASAPAPRRCYNGLMKRWIQRFATEGLACCRPAAAVLFGDRWQSDRRWQVLHYGFDFSPFAVRHDRSALRRGLGIAQDALVVGHVGRLVPQKNHALLIEVAREFLTAEPSAHFVIAGDGPLKPQVEKRIAELGLAERFTIMPNVPAVPQLLSAFDAFLFPSIHEGFPLVVVEAQAAGLPCILSDAITPEVNLFPQGNTVCSLRAPVSAWARALMDLGHAPPPQPSTSRLEVLSRSTVSIDHSIRVLDNLYVNQAAH